MARWAAVLVIVVATVAAGQQPAGAQDCSRAVIFALPGVTWEHVQELRPPHILAAAEDGAMASISVRTNSSRTTHASGFATIGAGTRIDVAPGVAQPFGAQESGSDDLIVPGVEQIDEAAAEQGYSVAVPGALGRAIASSGSTEAGGVQAIGNGDLGAHPPTPAGLARYSTLAAMDARGRVVRAATGRDLLEASPEMPFEVRTDADELSEAIEVALEDPCGVVVIDTGDLVRADVAELLQPKIDARPDALAAADEALGVVLDSVDPSKDLVVVVSPNSPLEDRKVHFGVAVAVGPGFEAGSSLSSSTTRRAGMVTLPDIAPTILEHLRIERPTAMLGRPWFTDGEAAGDRLAAAVDLDREAVFVDAVRTPISTAFVLFQLVVYAGAVWVLVRRRGPDANGSVTLRVLQVAALFLAAFPMATYVAGVIQGHEVGEVVYSLILVGFAGATVVTASLLVRSPLDRLLLVVGTTFALLIVDLVMGAPLQLNTVFSYSPIVAGRFAGIGNIGFAVLAATSVLTGALLVHRWGATKRSLTVVAALFALTVIVDGAPQFGSDVGGAIALVPGLAIAWILIAGKRPSLKSVLLAGVAGVVVLGIFLAADLARPEESRTHLARLYEDVRTGGGQVFVDAIGRKVRTNLRVLGSTIWTFVVPPALGLLAWLLLRPRWSWLSETYPKVHAGLVSGLIMSVLGYTVNDSGIVIPAMMFSYLVPVAVAPVSEATKKNGEPT